MGLIHCPQLGNSPLGDYDKEKKMKLEFRFTKTENGWLLTPVHSNVPMPFSSFFSSRTRAQRNWMTKLNSWLQGTDQFTIIGIKEDNNGE